MSETQLREAFTLMKQGDKAGAGRLIQSVLKEDRSNINAWWLFANVLEDEEKVVKALERVLNLNPEHLGARKKLAALRPEYAHLNPTSETLKAPQKPKAKQSYLKDNLAGLILLIGTAVVACFALIWGFMYMQAQLNPLDKFEHSPQDVAEAYYTAMYKEDIEALYAITCPARHEYIDELVTQFEGLNPADVTVNLSSTDFEIYNQSGDKAYVQIYGTMVYSYGGIEHYLDWVEDARANGYDGYGIFFERIDNVWLACNPYYIEDLFYTED